MSDIHSVVRSLTNSRTHELTHSRTLQKSDVYEVSEQEQSDVRSPRSAWMCGTHVTRSIAHSTTTTTTETRVVLRVGLGIASLDSTGTRELAPSLLDAPWH